MASKQTYECYVCRSNGFENIRVYIDRKTEAGKIIFKNPDMSPHIHKQGQQRLQQQQHIQDQQEQQQK
jgi:hypothetical protein